MYGIIYSTRRTAYRPAAARGGRTPREDARQSRAGRATGWGEGLAIYKGDKANDLTHVGVGGDRADRRWHGYFLNHKVNVALHPLLGYNTTSYAYS